jgi:hypothetical protein
VEVARHDVVAVEDARLVVDGDEAHEMPARLFVRRAHEALIGAGLTAFQAFDEGIEIMLRELRPHHLGHGLPGDLLERHVARALEHLVREHVAEVGVHHGDRARHVLREVAQHLLLALERGLGLLERLDVHQHDEHAPYLAAFVVAQRRIMGAHPLAAIRAMDELAIESGALAAQRASEVIATPIVRGVAEDLGRRVADDAFGRLAAESDIGGACVAVTQLAIEHARRHSQQVEARNEARQPIFHGGYGHGRRHGDGRPGWGAIMALAAFSPAGPYTARPPVRRIPPSGAPSRARCP